MITGEKILFAIYGITAVILLAIFLSSWMRGRYAERENHYLEVQNTLMRQYCESIRKQIALTRKLRHDIANHIHTLESLEAGENGPEASEYRAYLTGQYEKLRQTGYCQDILIDAVICQKKRACGEKHIRLDTELLTLSLPHMDETDRVRFFSELIDCGIREICGAREEEAEGRIHISSERKAGYIVINCDISPAGRRSGRAGRELRPLLLAAEKYGGFLRAEREKDAGGLRIQAAVRE